MNKAQNTKQTPSQDRFAQLHIFIKDNPKFQNSPFMQGYADGDNYFNMNGKQMNRAVYNLIINKRDLSLYEKCNMIPHRNWRIGDVKNYFGLTGNIKTLLPKYLELCEILLGTPNDKTL